MTGYAKMAEGRKSQVILLDDRRLDIIIQPKLYSSDLLDLVASHFKLREKHYFGLGFVDETYHFNWLQGEKRVLDHDFPKKTGLLVLHFAIRFYVETIGLLRDTQTVELFYLNARQAVFRSQIECDVNTVFELAAHVLQATNGDFVSEEETREELKKLPVIPTSTLKAHPSIGFCEDQVIEHYTKLCGSSRGLAIVNYMTIVEQLPTYGIHYYDVKDKKDIPWWLGISPRGIAVYDKNDKTTPRKLFTWKDLENLYYRDKKFSIEVHGPKREETCSHIVHTLSSFNPYEDAVREPVESYDDLSSAITDPTTQVSVSRRTFGASNVDVHAWFASTNQLTKCIWSMAVAQHQFYLDRKQSKSQLPTARSMSEIAADLCRSTTSLPGSLGSDLSRSPSSHSLPSLSNSRYDLTIEQSDSLKAERDMYAALLARREALEDALKKKLEELRAVCLQEGELTGDLPPELPLARGEQPPVFRRRVGTAFTLSAKKVQDTDQLSTELAQLELEVELQGKITSAAQRLASDKTVSKFVRKQRRQSYTKAVGKLKDMEKKLGDMRKQAGRNSSSQATVSQSPSRIFEDRLGPLPPVPQGKATHQGESANYEDQSHRAALSPSHSSPQLSAGYTPNGGIHGKGPYSRGHGSVAGSRNSSDFDTASSSVGTGAGVGDAPTTLQLAAALRLDGSHDSGFSSANNMYNINSQRTSHYESTDHLKSPASVSSEPLHNQFSVHHEDRGSSGGKTGVPTEEEGGYPLGSAQGKGAALNHMLHYGSLDRKRVVGGSGSVVADGGDQRYNYPASHSGQSRSEMYRDVSPARYGRKTLSSYSGSDAGDREDPVNTDNVVLEVEVQHQERGRPIPPSSSSSSVSSSTSSYKHPPRTSSPSSGSYPYHHHHQQQQQQYQSLHQQHQQPMQQQHHQHYHQQQQHSHAATNARSSSPGSGSYHHQQQQHSHAATNARSSSPSSGSYHQPQHPHTARLAPTTAPVEQHCYSPRMYESSGGPRSAYQDVDPSHIHARNVVSAAVAAAAQQEYAALSATLAGAHHTASQPVFHRQERSLSPLPAHQRATPTGELASHLHTSIPSPTQHLYSGSNQASPLDSPRSIPIQRVDTPPLLQGSSYSNPSSPRSGSMPGGCGAAPSALVTVSRLNQPHTEVTKPYELSDFYRYSEKLRRQRIIDQYQRQLIGAMMSTTSRSSSPQSVDSDAHSSHSGSHHSGPTSFNRAASSLPVNHPNSAPRVVQSSPFYQQTQRSLSPLNSYGHPEGQGHMTSSQGHSSSSSYTVKSSGPNVHYAVQSSSSFHIQQVHSTAKHAVYTPPQPMACQPIRKPPTGQSSDLQKR